MNSEVYKALADDNRLRILNILAERELCVCEIEEVLGITQSNASRHLNKLRQAGIIVSRKEAQWIYYSFSPDFRAKGNHLFYHLMDCFAEGNAMREERENAAAIPDKCDRRTFALPDTPIMIEREGQA